ncbi:peptide chain release factor N(5)-glutamine methyltransferase [Gloeocapsopsis dulcis]|uniref:Release factor glutamine methyltransferase n=1 Tax=Gloeocapsopsis dulcis AAB1 = 1H9 TaxID=1433147 RepID=A0A6N8FWX3_9CHRO|nr:peptide chain release factor N(5)-glutamine methyltransferase [Gloeocapsopsis dulcis]MUL37620.1 protein-(glutamine-N5) methyltransferase, release factor-specific [Gloeocapsopsis dulcis AAB1 = 1H9]WNN89245.1 peptide chain release factor N(5)-glutamine methyltransferase [Gloeocapsopsis dulcis]
MSQQLLTSGLALWQWRSAAQQAALAANIPVTEVDWLLQEVAGLDRLSLRLESFKNLPQISLQLSLEELETLWQRRINEHLPVQYIAGVTPWRHFKLAVSPAVLIPRPETEYLIDLAVAAVQKKRHRQLELGHWADLGTGSGAIALGLAQALPKATIHAVDCSAAALAVARQNAQALDLARQIHFYQGSWWEPLDLKGQLSGMVSNPPYIPSQLVPQLQPEVALHEPWLALNGGDDGLDCIRHLIATSVDYLQSGGIWLIEMMAGQAEIVAALLQSQGSYCNVEIYPDLAGIERFAVAYRKDEG